VIHAMVWLFAREPFLRRETTWPGFFETGSQE
jgi:hypothetical protein